MDTYVHDGSQMRKAQFAHVHDGTAWRDAKQIWVHDGTAWRQVFQGPFLEGTLVVGSYGFYPETYRGYQTSNWGTFTKTYGAQDLLNAVELYNQETLTYFSFIRAQNSPFSFSGVTSLRATFRVGGTDYVKDFVWNPVGVYDEASASNGSWLYGLNGQSGTLSLRKLT
jgi:hypothetical protein